MYCKQQGVDFTRSATLGRQSMNISPERLSEMLGVQADELLRPDEFLKSLGATSVGSIDNSAYEGASIICDMNRAISEAFYEKFSMLLDGGTLEHIYNFPQAIDNCKRLIEIGGHYIGMSPANNNCGHGFYQFSPELYCRVFGDDSGFHLKKLAWFQYGLDEWHDLNDPKVSGERHSITATDMVYLLIIAQKVKRAENSPTPQQSDYVRMWQQ
jgi:hypothetical protein